MKKTLPIVSLTIALIAVLIYTYTLSAGLSASKKQVTELMTDQLELEGRYNIVADGLVLAGEKVTALEEALRQKEEVVQSLEQELSDLDSQLSGEGDLGQRLADLIEDRTYWQTEGERLLGELASFQETTMEEVIANEDKTDLAEVINDLSDLDEALEDRISDLEDAAATLGSLSLERLMIQQEVGFLESIQSGVTQAMDNLTME